MSKYEHGDWYCMPASAKQAREIIDRAVASGAVNSANWQGNSICNPYGVTKGHVTYGDSIGTKYTIKQVRELFPLTKAQTVIEWDGVGRPPVGWHGEVTWGHKVVWHECVMLPEHVSYKHSTGRWVCDELSSLTGYEFRPFLSERDEWVDAALKIANNDVSYGASTSAIGALYDALRSGQLKAPVVE